MRAKRAKNFDMGGDQWLDGGGLRIFLMGGAGLHGGDKGLMGGPPHLPPHLVTLRQMLCGQCHPGSCLVLLRVNG